MSGQPQIPGVLSFDVTHLEISSAAPPMWDPSTIVEFGETAYVAAKFTGGGFVWEGLKRQKADYVVSYFAESIGPAEEKPLGEKFGKLTSEDTYGPPETEVAIAGKLTPGVYRVACVVTFPDWPGLTGYHEDLVIQVY